MDRRQHGHDLSRHQHDGGHREQRQDHRRRSSWHHQPERSLPIGRTLQRRHRRQQRARVRPQRLGNVQGLRRMLGSLDVNEAVEPPPRAYCKTYVRCARRRPPATGWSNAASGPGRRINEPHQLNRCGDAASCIVPVAQLRPHNMGWDRIRIRGRTPMLCIGPSCSSCSLPTGSYANRRRACKMEKRDHISGRGPTRLPKPIRLPQ